MKKLLDLGATSAGVTIVGSGVRMPMREGVVGGMKSYLVVRWKKRWHIVPIVVFFVLAVTMINKVSDVHQPLHRIVVGVLVFIAVVVLFPFR